MQRSATDPTAPNWTHLRSVETLFTVRMLLLAAFKDLSTCRAQRGRSCERGAAGGGDFPLIPWAFDLGKKICHSNVTTAETMHEAFVRSEEAFMANSTPKVTQPPLLDFGWPEDQVSDHARPHPVPLAPVSQPRGHASSGKHARRGRRIMTKAACRGVRSLLKTLCKSLSGRPIPLHGILGTAPAGGHHGLPRAGHLVHERLQRRVDARARRHVRCSASGQLRVRRL